MNLLRGKRYRGHYGWTDPNRVPRYEEVVIMKKPDTVAKAKAGQVSLPDDKFVTQYPMITEYLATQEWEDKTPREPSTLAVSLGDGMFKLALNDKELKQSLYTAAGTLQEALKLMEGALKAGNGEWRKWNDGKRKRG